MNKRITATIVICVMAAVVAGIALARPGGETTVAANAEVQEPASSESSGDESSSSESGEAAPIIIDQFAFSGNMTFAPGQTITVNNIDGSQHTLTSSDGIFDTGVLDAKSGTATFVAPTEPGTYPFFCSIHPSMTGTITITG